MPRGQAPATGWCPVAWGETPLVAVVQTRHTSAMSTTMPFTMRMLYMVGNGRSTVITNYDVIGWESEALIRINFMLGIFHQPK